MRAIDMFRARMVDGLLIYPVLHGRLDHLQRLRRHNFPVVLLVGIKDAGSTLSASTNTPAPTTPRGT